MEGFQEEIALSTFLAGGDSWIKWGTLQDRAKVSGKERGYVA